MNLLKDMNRVSGIMCDNVDDDCAAGIIMAPCKVLAPGGVHPRPAPQASTPTPKCTSKLSMAPSSGVVPVSNREGLLGGIH